MDQEFSQTIQRIIRRDDRYPADAYEFVNEAVTYTAKELKRTSKPKGDQHVTAGELVCGGMDWAFSQYGFLAPEVLKQWRILCGVDFGNIVYNMIAVNLLSASPEDSQDDFQCHPDLVGELRERIERRLSSPAPQPPPFLD